MVVEVSLSGKRLFARQKLADVGFLSRVESKVSLQITFFVKRLAASFVWTNKVAYLIVLFYVYLESLDAAVRLIAVWISALILLDVVVSRCVILKVSFGHKCFAAKRK